MPRLRRSCALTLLAMLSGTVSVHASAPATAAPPERDAVALESIHPTPQEVDLRPDGFPLTPVVTLVSGKETDPSALRELREALQRSGVRTIHEVSDEDGASPEGPLTFYVGGDEENRATSGALGALDVPPAKGTSPEGYVLAAGRDHDGRALVALAGNGKAGTFYAVQTFEQTIEHRSGLDRVPGMEVRDHPTMPERGVIEGFYGDPWSQGDRLSQLEFYGEQKLNTYVYAPKDDPYHRERWRDPYPPDRLDEIGKLVDAARAEHVRFVFSVSPGATICYSGQKDFQSLLDKSQAVWDVGVRSFDILLDDIDPNLRCAEDRERFGDDASPAAAAQAYLLNRFQREFLDTHPGAHRLGTVPTEYAGNQASTYRTHLADLLLPRIEVYWTGPDVVSPVVTADDAARAQAVFDHDLVLWDNYPVNDYQRDRLFLGPLVGRSTALTDEGVRGLVSNPMNQAEASKIPLFTAADYDWNPADYRPENSWRAALTALGGKTADALRVFAENNRSSPLSELESPTLTDLMERYWKTRDQQDGQQAEDALAAYFDDMATAPGHLRSGLDNQAFLDEVKPWLDKLGDYGRAGGSAVAMLAAERQGDWTTAWRERAAMEDAARAADAIPQTVAPGVVDPFLARARSESRLVTMAAPADGAKIAAGSDVHLAAEVRSGAVPIQRVDFYAGPQKVGTDDTAPYDATWQNPPDGQYTLYAVARAADGSTVRSPAVRATVGDPKPVLFVAGGADLSEGDAETVQRLRYLGYPVQVESAKESDGSDAQGKAAVIVSSTVSSGDVGSDFTDVHVPVMSWESYVFDDLGMSRSVGEEWNRSVITVTAPAHPTAAGRSGTVRVYQGLDRLRWGDVAPGGTTVATLPEDSSKATLFTYDDGQQMFNGPAPARRVGIFLGDTGTSVLTPDGTAMFDAAVSWLTGRS